jgi:dTDP-4-dehydrorhamnose 3,5-epimerase-like enzyme
MICPIVNFNVRENYDGKLVALEAGKDIPFEIKRVYYIWGNRFDVIRGKHAHRKLEQIVICMAGSCDFVLDNGTQRETVHLDGADKGIYIKNNIWREFTNFSSDCVIVVLASEHYDEADYIRDYAQYKKEITHDTSIV